VELCVFGPVKARGPSGPIEFTRDKERAVLATLALFHGSGVSTDRLVDAIWRDEPPARVEKAIQTYVHRIRAVLGAGVIETRGDGYALAADVLVDVELFESGATETSSVQRLHDALGRWTGEPYVDLGEWPPAEMERDRLAEMRDYAREVRVALEIDAGHAPACVAELESMVADKPLRERRWFLLMTALARDGRTADALRTYQRARKVFAVELGIDPGADLRSLEEQILFADVREASPGNLPRQLTSFVGRDHEVLQVARLVHERSLVTLTGVGGVGKTRLALETAAAIVADFRDGAWLCELAPVADPAVLWEALAAGLRVHGSPGGKPRDVVLDYLAVKRLLLVLDNCEHLVVAAGRCADEIAQACPGVAVLATSRERLAVSGEVVVAVSPLPVPRTGPNVDGLAQSAAVRLFCDRARDVRGVFALDDGNGAAVAQLCRQLDGIPLAIELAAARVRSVSPAELLSRIDERFRLLNTGSRSSPERHQALRNTIDWSYDMLADNEQRAVNRMSVFAGGCDLASAEAVVAGDEDISLADVANVLSQLVDKSLVEIDVSEEGWRYRLFETIRQYARERLEATGETVAARDRHLARYIDLAEKAGAHLRGRDQLRWATALARDTDNFRAALDWAVEAELVEAGLRLVVPLTVPGLPTGRWTSRDWAEIAITVPGASQHPLYPQAAAHAAMVAIMHVDVDRAAVLVAAAEQSQSRHGTHHTWVYGARAVLALLQADFEQAEQRAEKWVEVARVTQDAFDIASALVFHAATRQSDAARCAVVAEEAVRVSRDAEITSTLLYALLILTQAVAPEQPARARELLAEAAEVARKLGDGWGIATAVAYQASIAMVQSDWHASLRAATDAAGLFLQSGVSLQLGATFTTASVALAHLGFPEPAAAVAGLVDARFPPAPVEGWDALTSATEQLILDALGSARTAEVKAQGATLTIADGVAYLRRESERVFDDEQSAKDNQAGSV
jgi:predicted ATPase/DNA-binding SARP family transcriptional activator